ncbi:ElaB/YqjD/DUF883 family membrane-anchored ribosome-binding protein [Sphingomonas sp. F9_3S_D5_B_2]
MADNETALPEGTDTVIAGASQTGTVEVNTTLVEEREIPAPTGDAERPSIGSGSAEGGLADRLRSGRERLMSQGGDRARGLVSQGLERSSEALASVGRMVGDTATGLDDRLGNEYGDYARRAASAIENVANNIASKDPDELMDDARGFVRNSPGVALAGAAVVGFVLARLVKSGLGTTGNDEGDERD